MNICTIAWRNLRHRPLRGVTLLLLFSLGIMSIVALYQVSLVVGETLERKLSAYGANIIISPAVEKLAVSYGGFHLGDMLFDVRSMDEAATVHAIRSIDLNDRISLIAPKLVAKTHLAGAPIAVVGVRWDEEIALKSYWRVQGDFPEGPEEVVLGSELAERLGFSLGDTARLDGRAFRVSGVLAETGGDDDHVLFADIGAVQEMENRSGAASFVEVAALCTGCPIDDIVAQLRARLPDADVKALQSVVNQRMASIGFVQKLVFIVSLVILVTAAAMVSLSMLAAVNERRKDIGVLRALGFSKAQVFGIISLEAGLLGLVAGWIGYLAGFVLGVRALQLLAITEAAAPQPHLSHLLLAGLLTGTITVLATVYPAWKGASVEPSEALAAI